MADSDATHEPQSQPPDAPPIYRQEGVYRQGDATIVRWESAAGDVLWTVQAKLMTPRGPVSFEVEAEAETPEEAFVAMSAAVADKGSEVRAKFQRTMVSGPAMSKKDLVRLRAHCRRDVGEEVR